MIVVDINIIVYAWLNTDHTRRARHLMQCEPEWHAPLLWRSELRNVLVGEIRRERIKRFVANDVLRSAERWLSGHEHLPASVHVLELANDSGCTAYDCEFVAIAEQLDVPLVTMDGALLKAFPRHTLDLEAAGKKLSEP